MLSVRRTHLIKLMYHKVIAPIISVKAMMPHSMPLSAKQPILLLACGCTKKPHMMDLIPSNVRSEEGHSGCFLEACPRFSLPYLIVSDLLPQRINRCRSFWVDQYVFEMKIVLCTFQKSWMTSSKYRYQTGPRFCHAIPDQFS